MKQFSQNQFWKEMLKQIQKEMALQARIQILTEDKEAMGKDNDIIRQELKENNYWIDNRLMKALEEAGNV